MPSKSVLPHHGASRRNWPVQVFTGSDWVAAPSCQRHFAAARVPPGGAPEGQSPAPARLQVDLSVLSRSHDRRGGAPRLQPLAREG